MPDNEREPAKSNRRDAVIVGVFLAVVATAAVLMIPSIIGVREAAARSKDTSHLKQLALAAHNFADSDAGGVVGPYVLDDEGEVYRGLSFRVSLLPYIEQHKLHDRIDRTKPWDDPANAPATATPIRHLQSPVTPDAAKPDTPYRVFYGGGALFEADGAPVRLDKIPDGTSNTILFVHATEAVPWAKPQEFAYDRSTPLPPLGSKGLGDGFHAAMADGSVRFLKSTIPEADLRSLIEKADGRQVLLD